MLRFIGAMFLLAVGCASGPAQWKDVKARYSFEASCPSEQTQVVILDKMSGCIVGDEACARAVGVRGCGKQTIFVQTASGWVRNAEIEKAADVAAAPSEQKAP